MINNSNDLANYLGLNDPELLAWYIYKHTECGASLEVKTDSISLCSIIEGDEAVAGPYTMTFPFTEDNFENLVELVEREAERIWNRSHGCPHCWTLGQGRDRNWQPGQTRVDPKCKECDGEGIVI